jgi:hypothetical protein
MTSFSARLRMLFAVLSNKPFEVRRATIFGGGRFSVRPHDGLLLPVISGGSPEGDGDEGDGSDGDEGADGSGDDGDGSAAGDDGDGDGDGDDGDGDADAGDDIKAWKNQSRKHERRAKNEKKKREEADAKLKKREEADKSEQEKAIDKAREEGRTSALTEAEKERRSDRLEVAVTRLANKTFTLGEGADATKARFADSDDALLYIERAISKGEIDADDIFDENNKVKVDALKGELAELLESKPHYQARSEVEGEGKGKGKAANGGGDQGKGSGAGSKDLEEMSADDHFKRIKRS